MSGFEIAGVVLGTIPLIISALQAYQKTASTIQRWRFYSRELKSLIRNLDTERVKLQNVCERLLMGLVSVMQMEEMINCPFGEAWKEKDLYDQIRQRLWNSHVLFEETILDIEEAITEIKDRLRMRDDGTVGFSILRTFTGVPLLTCTKN